MLIHLVKVTIAYHCYSSIAYCHLVISFDFNQGLHHFITLTFHPKECDFLKGHLHLDFQLPQDWGFVVTAVGQLECRFACFVEVVTVGFTVLLHLHQG